MNLQWIELNSIIQIDEIKENSYGNNVIVFKHSTRCGISHHISQMLDENADSISKLAKFYYLDLLAYRSISDAITLEFDVIHQSPQILLIKNGEARYTASHYAIKPEFLLDQLQ